jgi:anti-sigma regulatory factor (Ser/Thr protein kinase)
MEALRPASHWTAKNAMTDLQLSFELKNDLSELDRLCEKLEIMGQELGLTPKCCFELNLALEEHFTNIISHAYPDDAEHWITFSFCMTDSKLTICIEDDGQSFDPAAVIQPDTHCSIENRDIGGLGIHLIKKIMDEITYQRCQNKNILKLTKKI